MNRRKRRPARESNARFLARVLAERDRLARKLPDMDPGDLLMIVESLHRPPGSGRIFFLKRDDKLGGYVF
jgi:hypothetical protein